MHTAKGRLMTVTNSPAAEMVGGDHEDNGAVIARIVNDVPHYIADRNIVELSFRPDVVKSMRAMQRAGIRELPFDPVMVEYTKTSVWKDTEINVNVWVRLQSSPLFGPCLTPLPYDILSYVVAMTAIPRENDDEDLLYSVLLSDPYAPVAISWVNPENEKGNTPFVVWKEGDDDISDKARHDRHMRLMSVEAMNIAYMMLNTRGLATRHVDCAAMDRARERHGKPRIGSYSVIHIGTIYDRHGKGHAATGYHMPVHYRAGHIRQQPCGPKLSKVKPVFIKPCIVNYDPATGRRPGLPIHEIVE